MIYNGLGGAIDFWGNARTILLIFVRNTYKFVAAAGCSQGYFELTQRRMI
jgi:hypothetical protein